MSSSHQVGILAIEVYFPHQYVSQEDLEVSNGVSKGKYTVGLGQESMAFTGDLEDINSICLTAVKSLLEKYDISPLEIGRMEVGTESLVDKSKSTKTVLMSLFEGSGNTDIEGATVVNACYGGTAALLNALVWVDSSAWDGRLAIVVAGDIAVYADGPARPTGGCGAVAMLLGRGAPLEVDLRSRASHASHVWDFFKPNLLSEYPEVNGALSQTCYLQALDDCYSRFSTKQSSGRLTVKEVDHFLFHSPYNKLVQKSFARLLYLDALQSKSQSDSEESLSRWLGVPSSQTYEDKELEAALKTLSASLYNDKVSSSCDLSRRIGNTYTASLYMNLADLVAQQGEQLAGRSVVMFSYGSGALASMFKLIPHSDNNNNNNNDKRFSLSQMQLKLDLPRRLSARTKRSPSDLDQALRAREAAHEHGLPFSPSGDRQTELADGTFFLKLINEKHERVYERK